MNFRETVAYLDSFINYEKKGSDCYPRSFKLERLRRFLSLIGDPQESFKSIHVAGTKGKGSVCIFCAHILRESGLRVGLYTSPHLHDIRERIRVLEPAGRRGGDFEGMIPRAGLAAVVNRLRPVIERFCRREGSGKLTFFEVYTAAAFAYFKERRVDCAVLETGLGGRCDATNVVRPVACCLTPISRDHAAVLGKTVAAIAGEKAGIIKRVTGGLGVVSAPQPAAAAAVIRRVCRHKGARLLELGAGFRARGYRAGGMQHFSVSGACGGFKDVAIRLCGNHQVVNASCAIATCVEACAVMGHPLGRPAITRGCASAVWPGRFERCRGFILDGAHNGHSARELARTLREHFPGKRVIMIVGVSRDKELRSICRELRPVSAMFIATAARHPRAFPPETIGSCIRELAPSVPVRVSAGVAQALAMAPAGRVRCVTGSLFVVAEARKHLMKDTNGN